MATVDEAKKDQTLVAFNPFQDSELQKAGPITGISSISADALLEAKNQQIEASYRHKCESPILFEAQPSRTPKDPPERRLSLIFAFDNHSSMYLSNRGDAVTGKGYAEPNRGVSIQLVGKYVALDDEGNPVKDGEDFVLEDGDIHPIATLKVYRTRAGRDSTDDAIAIRHGYGNSRFGIPILVIQREGQAPDEQRDMSALGMPEVYAYADKITRMWPRIVENDRKQGLFKEGKHPLEIIYEWSKIPLDDGAVSKKKGTSRSGYVARTSAAKPQVKVEGVEQLAGQNPLAKAPQATSG